ncbi:5-formyltetrahydrofolate cyclo-ligase [Ostertagia ostertagi]
MAPLWWVNINAIPGVSNWELHKDRPLKFVIEIMYFRRHGSRDAQRLSVYVHTGGEIETDRIVEESLKQGKQLFIPKFTKGDPHMRSSWRPLPCGFSEVENPMWGIRQPGDNDQWEDYEETGALDLILMPGVAFTTTGCRLGPWNGLLRSAFAATVMTVGVCS